jgi:hypothetical protein
MTTKELVLNGDFAAGTSDWNFLGDSFLDPSEGVGGTECAGLKGTPGTEIYQDKIKVVKGAWYDFVLVAKGQQGETFRMVVIGVNNSSTVSLPTQIVGKEYSRYRFNFVAQDELIRIKVMPIKVPSVMYVDNVSVTGTTLSFWEKTEIEVLDNSNGLIFILPVESITSGNYSLFIPSIGSYVTISINVKTEPTGTTIPSPSYNPTYESTANCAEYVNYYPPLIKRTPVYPDNLYTFVTDISYAYDFNGLVCLTYDLEMFKKYVDTHNVGYTTV